ncbi:hypothetical protein HanLR1_Chr07g0249781 [Helianthus annuus]|nr:hypothetical protein HanHA89_Chr07g0267371 [Helianthus annuus]KAJ0729154.1 hypothetical protein HanLR1_Chr07g0249781 [Helianthus annuus]
MIEIRGVQNSFRIRKIRNSFKFDSIIKNSFRLKDFEFESSKSNTNRIRIYNFKFDSIRNSNKKYTFLFNIFIYNAYITFIKLYYKLFSIFFQKKLSITKPTT